MKPNDAQIAELQKLAMTGGGVLTPEAVVEAARHRSSVLHEAFEWDDKEAAKEHRLGQARSLISYVEVVTHTTTTRQEVYAYVRDPSLGRMQGYLDIRSQRAQDNRIGISRYYITLAVGMLQRALAIADELGVDHPFTECLVALRVWRDGVDQGGDPGGASPVDEAA